MMNDPHRHLIRSGALALGSAGLLSGAALAFHPDEFVPGALLDPAWRPVHLVLLVGFLLTIPGLTALHLRQSSRAGALGCAAYLTATVGSTLSVALVAIEAFVLPAFAGASETPKNLMDLLAPGTPLSSLGVLFGASIPIWIVGWILMGVTTMRAGVLSPRAGILLVIASVMVAVPVHFLGGLGPIAHLATAAALGGAWTWLGTLLWRSTTEASLAEPAAGVSIAPVRP